MKITWLGQFGLLIETGGKLIMTDPYLTDSIFERGVERCRRTVPPEPQLLSLRPDMLLLTHDHSDHLDVPSLRCLLSGDSPADVLCAANAWTKVRAEIGGAHNYVCMAPGTEWSTDYAHVRAVPAFHSDPTALGFVIHAEGKTVYLTGDSLYSPRLSAAVSEPVDAMFTVINGVGNNMNCIDAARLAREIDPGFAVPVHWGLFAALSADPQSFASEAAKRRVKTKILRIYDHVEL